MDIFGKRERDFHRRNRSTIGSCVGLDETVVGSNSEQLESFRKFCEEQNSEGVQESTPSASNTESAYQCLVPLLGTIIGPPSC
jgi:hypothetical protein